MSTIEQAQLKLTINIIILYCTCTPDIQHVIKALSLALTKIIMEIERVYSLVLNTTHSNGIESPHVHTSKIHDTGV